LVWNIFVSYCQKNLTNNQNFLTPYKKLLCKAHVKMSLLETLKLHVLLNKICTIFNILKPTFNSKMVKVVWNFSDD